VKYERGGYLRELCDLMGEVSANQLIDVAFGKKLAINHVGGYFPIDNDAEIEYLTDYIYTKEDIKISKFEGGKHYYATIGGISVVDNFGDNKWYSEQRAYDKAVEFLEKVNKKS
jgi:hypothetical protein